MIILPVDLLVDLHRFTLAVTRGSRLPLSMVDDNDRLSLGRYRYFLLYRLIL